MSIENFYFEDYKRDCLKTTPKQFKQEWLCEFVFERCETKSKDGKWQCENEAVHFNDCNVEIKMCKDCYKVYIGFKKQKQRESYYRLKDLDIL